MRLKIIYTAIILVLILTGILLLKVFKPEKNMAKQNHDYYISAVDLFKEFDADEQTANDKYIGRIIELTGTIKEIDAVDSRTIIILETEDLFSGISCSLSKNNIHQLESLKVGDSIIVRGECSGKLLDVVLINCVIVNKKEQ